VPEDGTIKQAIGGAPESPSTLHGRTGTQDVFISYASADKAAADSICSALEHAGMNCWIAPRDVTPGVFYADAIVEAINSSRILIVVLSVNSAGSQHVLREVERASSKRRPLVAFRLDTTPLPTGLEYFLSASHWLDASGGSIDRALPGLTIAIHRLLGAPGKLGAEADATDAGARGTTPQSRRKLLWSGAAIAVIVLAALLAGKLRLLTRSAMESAKGPVATVKSGASGTAATTSGKSLAVLPFRDMSEKHDQEYFADGIAEEVLDRLAKVPGLKVVGHASSFQFKGRDADPASIGTALGVAYLLEGSVRKETARVRVTAELIEAKTGSQRWTDHFDSDLLDALKVQDTIAAELARALEITVDVGTVPRSSVKSPEVLDAYLRALQSFNRYSQESSEAAVANFQNALALDPAFAPAAVGLARAYAFTGAAGWLPPRIAYEHARAAALLAQRLDPKDSSPHITLAEIHTHYDWDWSGADRELQQAFALGPRDAYGAQTASTLAAALGQFGEARQLAIEAIALDPLYSNAHAILGFEIYLRSGYLPAAEQSLRRALQIAPGWGSGQYFLGEALMLQGNHEAALAEFGKETLEDGQLEGSAMVYFATGRKAESDSRLDEAIRRNGASWPSEIARVYAFRSEKDHAFEWLNKAYEMRDEDLYFIKGDPLFKNLENDPRFTAFLRKMNLPQ
jgi:TolB-like protein